MANKLFSGANTGRTQSSHVLQLEGTVSANTVSFLGLVQKTPSRDTLNMKTTLSASKALNGRSLFAGCPMHFVGFSYSLATAWFGSKEGAAPAVPRMECSTEPVTSIMMSRIELVGSEGEVLTSGESPAWFKLSAD